MKREFINENSTISKILSEKAQIVGPIHIEE